MMAKSHAAVGVASWVIVAPSLQLARLSIAGLVLVLAGALLPDIDHPQSWVGRRSRPISTMLGSLLGHRGVTHSAVAVIALVALLVHSGSPRVISSAFAVGYLSHLAADMLTPRGLRLAWPLRRTWGWPLCRTGSFAELGIVTGICLLAAWLSFHSIRVQWFAPAVRACGQLGAEFSARCVHRLLSL